MLTKLELQALAVQYARLYDLDAKLVFAVIEKESSWDTFAVRYEPHWKYRF